jgi:hypothetical protein
MHGHSLTLLEDFKVYKSQGQEYRGNLREFLTKMGKNQAYLDETM